MKVYKPTTSLPEKIEGPSVFLAGSIEQGKAELWQDQIIKSLADKHVTIFNPRRDEWNADWVQSIENPDFTEQVNWELDALELSDIVVFYFDPNTKSPITLFELGFFFRVKKIIICCPPGFWRKGNIEVFAKRYNVALYESKTEFFEAVKNLF